MEKESEIVLEIASRFFNFVTEAEKQWDEAYLRYHGDNDNAGVTSTVRRGDVAHYIDFDDEIEFEVMSEITDLCQQLQKHFPFKVSLLVVRPNQEFKIKYEKSLSSKWEITKLNGNSGIPSVTLREVEFQPINAIK